MGPFGKMKLDRHRLKPGDTDTWQMGQDGLIQGDTAVTQERLPSYFQGGDKFTGRDALAGILAAVGDAFAQRGGMQGGAMQNLTGGRMSALKMAQDAQQAQLERQQGREDFEWQLGKKAEYDKPTPNDTERDYGFMVQTVGQEAADNWLRRRGDPMVNMSLPNGQFYAGPQSGLSQALGGGQPPPPPKPVGRLTPIGGAATPGTPPFPVPRRYR